MKKQVRTSLHIDLGDGGAHDFVLDLTYSGTPAVPESGAGYLADPYHYDPGAGAEVCIEEIHLSNEAGECAIPHWMMSLIRADEMLREFLIKDMDSH